jgi:AI-2 transport protein TqsA
MSMFPKFTFFTNRKVASPLSATSASSEKSTTVSYPFYIKAPMVLLGLFLFFYIMMLLRDVLVPLSFALLLSILLNPLVNFLVSRKIPRMLAITIAMLVAVLVFGGIIIFLSTQIASFTELAPQLAKRANEIMDTIHTWVSQKLGISVQKQNKMLNDAMGQAQSYVGSTLATIADFASAFVLLPIYVVCILYYKPLIINFFYEVFDNKHGKKVSDVLTQTKSAIQSYIVGLLTETFIVSAMNSVALLIIGVIGGLLNLIPYIGGLIAIALPVAISLVTSDPVNYTTPFIIIGAYIVIQFIDNNLLVPNIVSSKVEVNALISIVIVLLGSAIWGVSGMFLSIPFVAILKIIFDRIDELKPWGMLLGTTMNPDFSLQDIGSREAESKSALNEITNEIAEENTEENTHEEQAKNNEA